MEYTYEQHCFKKGNISFKYCFIYIFFKCM